MHRYVGFQGGASGKESTYNAGDVRDTGSIPGSGRSLEEGVATHSSILAWRIPWTEEPGGVTVHRVTKSQTPLKRLSTHDLAPMQHLSEV